MILPILKLFHCIVISEERDGIFVTNDVNVKK